MQSYNAAMAGREFGPTAKDYLLVTANSVGSGLALTSSGVLFSRSTELLANGDYPKAAIGIGVGILSTGAGGWGFYNAIREARALQRRIDFLDYAALIADEAINQPIPDFSENAKDSLKERIQKDHEAAMEQFKKVRHLTIHDKISYVREHRKLPSVAAEELRDHIGILSFAIEQIDHDDPSAAIGYLNRSILRSIYRVETSYRSGDAPTINRTIAKVQKDIALFRQFREPQGRKYDAMLRKILSSHLR